MTTIYRLYVDRSRLENNPAAGFSPLSLAYEKCCIYFQVITLKCLFADVVVKIIIEFWMVNLCDILMVILTIILGDKQLEAHV
jgi:hypothetical protein